MEVDTQLSVLGSLIISPGALQANPARSTGSTVTETCLLRSTSVKHFLLHHICTTSVSGKGSSTVINGQLQRPGDLHCCKIAQVAITGRAALIMLRSEVQVLLAPPTSPGQACDRSKRSQRSKNHPASVPRSTLSRASV